jgi:hypothetical protein
MRAQWSKRTTQRLTVAIASGVAVSLALAGSGAARLPQGSEPVTLDPAEFTTKVDNPYFPLKVGSRWVYRETDKEGTRQKVVVTVTDRTKLIANGVTARVVKDVVTEEGQFIEVTNDFYAQDEDGNVWYLGEATTEYENGKPVSTEGSFEAGVGGAQPGVIMPAKPRRGLEYRQEYFAGHAEDRAKVRSLHENVSVPFGSFDRVLKTKDIAPLPPKSFEVKFYVRGMGLVDAFTTKGGSDHEVLLKFKRGR